MSKPFEQLLSRSYSSTGNFQILKGIDCRNAIFGIVVTLIVCGIMAFAVMTAIWPFIETAIGIERIDSTRPSKSPSCQKRIVGYYSEKESIDITLNQLEKITHAVFAFVEMEWNGQLRFKSEIGEEKFLSLKRKADTVKNEVKVMFSIGGSNNSQFFSSVTAEPRKTKTFIESILSFLQKYEVDGVDIHWKYAEEKDKFHYLHFLRDLKQRFQESHSNEYIISVTLPAPLIETWENAYDLDQTLEYVDFINVHSMDYHGPWNNQWGDTAGPSAPLYSGHKSTGGRRNFNVDHTMQYYVCKTKRPDRFNMAIPFYAMLWRNVKGPFVEGVNVVRWVELKNGGAEGQLFMSRYDVDRGRWKLDNATWDETTRSAYIWNPETRVYLAFENEKSISEKIKYVNEKNLGGIWIWSIEMDDDKNSLLNESSSDELCSRSDDRSLKYNC